ncbi:acyl-CoA dehydrogenase family protein [Streptomyces sp. NPDC058548]|uniref:acyl-CoA dehydrogenase family protein n=1 Tax=unclassified Streptomyces TaxID=2593676 RepID=UPI0036498E96
MTDNTEPARYQPELVRRAEALLPLVRDHAAGDESRRSLSKEVVDALEQAELTRITQPRRFGGREADFRTVNEVCETLGTADASTGWVTAIINSSAILTATFPDRAQREFWEEDPTAKFCGVLRWEPDLVSRSVDGGMVVTGRWPYASGCDHVQWAVLGVPILDASGQQVDIGLATIPRSELTIEDTWFVAGMAASGSKTLVANEVFVPGHRIAGVNRLMAGDFPTEHADEVLYRSPLLPHLAIVLVGPFLGAVRGAMELVDENLRKGRPIAYTFYEKAREAATTQLARAEAQKAYDIAALLLNRATKDVDDAAEAGIHPSEEARLRVRWDVATCMSHLRKAMSLLLDINGASSFAEGNPLQRMWRDLEVASRHGYLLMDVIHEGYGRALVGVDEPFSPFV